MKMGNVGRWIDDINNGWKMGKWMDEGRERELVAGGGGALSSMLESD